jgi:hypothetical protein
MAKCNTYLQTVPNPTNNETGVTGKHFLANHILALNQYKTVLLRLPRTVTIAFVSSPVQH